MTLYKDMETGRYVPNSGGSSWSGRKEEEKQLIDNLLNEFSWNRHPYSKTRARCTAAYRTFIFIFVLKSYSQIIF